MTLEEFRKKYEDDTAGLMIEELVNQCRMGPYMDAAYRELVADLRSMLKWCSPDELAGLYHPAGP